MINNDDAVKLLDSKRGDAVIIATMNANNVNFGLSNLSTNPKLDFPVSGAMSKASSVGLGLALAQPERARAFRPQRARPWPASHRPGRKHGAGAAAHRRG